MHGRKAVHYFFMQKHVYLIKYNNNQIATSSISGTQPSFLPFARTSGNHCPYYGQLLPKLRAIIATGDASKEMLRVTHA